MCAVIAIVVATLVTFLIVSSMDFRVSSLVRMAVTDPIAQRALEIDPGFAVFPGDHYDGIYFYAMALDPFATGDEHRLIDLPGARYGHVLYAWVAALLSLGNGRLVPLALLFINLVSIGVLAWGVSTLARDMGWTPWAGLLVAVNPGFLYAIAVDTSEVFGSMLVVLLFIAWFRRRWGLVVATSIAACLAKELFLFVPVGLAGWELLWWLKGRAAPDLMTRIAVLATGPFVWLLWEVYLRSALGYWAFKDDLHVLTIPFVGWAETFQIATGVGKAGSFEAVQVAAASLPLLAAVGVGLLIGSYCAVRLRNPFALIYLAMALLSFSLTWRNLYYAKDMIRQMSPVLLLLPAVIVGIRPGSRLDLETEPGEALASPHL
jgi:hypothetical protein